MPISRPAERSIQSRLRQEIKKNCPLKISPCSLRRTVLGIDIYRYLQSIPRTILYSPCLSLLSRSCWEIAERVLRAIEIMKTCITRARYVRIARVNRYSSRPMQPLSLRTEAHTRVFSSEPDAFGEHLAKLPSKDALTNEGTLSTSSTGRVQPYYHHSLVFQMNYVSIHNAWQSLRASTQMPMWSSSASQRHQTIFSRMVNMALWPKNNYCRA